MPDHAVIAPPALSLSQSESIYLIPVSKVVYRMSHTDESSRLTDLGDACRGLTVDKF